MSRVAALVREHWIAVALAGWAALWFAVMAVNGRGRRQALGGDLRRTAPPA